MSVVLTAYRRLLVDLRPGNLDRATLRAAASLARLLKVEMLGIFVEDQSAVGAASLPFTRELRLPARSWQSVDTARLAAEYQVAAEQARVLLVHEGQVAGVNCDFVVRRGDPATTIAGLCTFHDIVAVAEPGAAIERLTGTADRVRKAAMSSQATVLLLPPRPGRLVGAIVALIAEPGDPALVVAARLAAVSDKPLVVMSTADTQPAIAAVQDAARQADPAPQRIEVLPLRGRTAASVLHALGGRHVGLVVMSRDGAGLPEAAPAHFADTLGVPVLVIEPPQATPHQPVPAAP
jgi:hypothetical protein